MHTMLAGRHVSNRGWVHFLSVNTKGISGSQVAAALVVVAAVIVQYEYS